MASTNRRAAAESITTLDGRYVRLAAFDGLCLIQPSAQPDATPPYRDITGSLPQTPTLAELLYHMERNDLAQVWIHPLASYPVRSEDERGYPTPGMLEDARGQGWNVSRGKSGDQPWLSCYHPGVYGLRTVYWPALDNESAYQNAPDSSTSRMALSLARLTMALGMFWSKSPGGTGNALMKRTIAEKQRRYSLTAIEIPEPAEHAGRHLDGAPIWLRDLLPHEEKWRYLVSVDRNGAWLAAAGAFEWGIGAPHHLDGAALANMQADYVLAKHARAAMVLIGDYQRPALPTGMPDPISAYRLRRQRGTGWVSLPTIRLLDELHASYSVREVYYWDQGARALYDWYGLVGTARLKLIEQGDAPALAMVKGMYTKSLGWLGADERDGWDRSEDAFYRPDVYAGLKALSRANLWRAASRVERFSASVSPFGFVPMAVSTDAWYYILPTPDALRGVVDEKGAPVLSLGTRLADWKETVYDLDDGAPGAALRKLLTDASRVSDARLSAMLHLLNLIDAEKAERGA